MNTCNDLNILNSFFEDSLTPTSVDHVLTGGKVMVKTSVDLLKIGVDSSLEEGGYHYNSVWLII